MHTQLKNDQTLLFIGDSITDAGRRDRAAPLGDGYVKLFADLLTIREPGKRIRIINRGIGGHKVEDLRSRWADHVLSNRPDWLVVKIGVNDLNHYLCNPKASPDTNSKAFGEIFDQVITITRRELPDVEILIVSPFVASTDGNAESYRARLLAAIPDYILAAQTVAKRHGTRFLDLQAAVSKLLQDLPPDSFSDDAIHPTPAGALFIAEQVYAALG
jgi:lysophospholipase L1-like esterase